MPVPQLPLVKSYHAKIMVNKGDKMLVATVDRPDWSHDHDIIADLAKETGAHTVGEALVRAGADVKEADITTTNQDKHVFEWGDLIS